MDTQAHPNFPRRLDRNGIYHSICLTCFQTVATSFSQTTLVEGERHHICEGPPARMMARPGLASQIGAARLADGQLFQPCSKSEITEYTEQKREHRGRFSL